MAGELIFPGNQQTGTSSPLHAPVNHDRSFLYVPYMAASEKVLPCFSLEDVAQFEHADYLRHPAYAAYMRMNKVFVNKRGAEQLEQIHRELIKEEAPRYLVVAGWTAAETALMDTEKSVQERMDLLGAGVVAWQKALVNQERLEGIAPRENIELDTQNRISLDIAVSPLVAGMIMGDVTNQTCKKVFEDCLVIAKINAGNLQAAINNRDTLAMSHYIGLGYELNALLAFNRRLSQSWFAMPAIARADSGYHHPEQTHDLLIVHQNYGVIKSATPVEIKAKASLRDRRRYNALLVRGKMHLSVEGKFAPEHTLNAIDAVERGIATQKEDAIADNATDRFVTMVRDYYAGEILGKIAGRRTLTVFHDSSQVIERHPGLSKFPIAN